MQSNRDLATEMLLDNALVDAVEAQLTHLISDIEGGKPGKRAIVVTFGIDRTDTGRLVAEPKVDLKLPKPERLDPPVIYLGGE